MDDRAETKGSDDEVKTVEYWPRRNLSYAVKSVVVIVLIVLISSIVVIAVISLLSLAAAK